MEKLKSYCLIYASFATVALPWVLYKAWENRDVPGGINEAFEGFFLHLILTVLFALGFAILLYLSSRFNKLILNRKSLILASLTAGAIIFYTRVGYANYPILFEIFVFVIILGLFTGAKKVE